MTSPCWSRGTNIAAFIRGRQPIGNRLAPAMPRRRACDRISCLNKFADSPPADLRPGFREFVVLMAGADGAERAGDRRDGAGAAGDRRGAAASPTTIDRQLVVSVYLLGFGATQLIYGPLVRPLRPQAGADRLPGPLRRASASPARAGGELHPAARGAVRAGRGGGGDAGAGRVDRPRPLRGRGDGAADVASSSIVFLLDAGAGADLRPAHPCWSRRGAGSSSALPPIGAIMLRLDRAPAARDARTRSIGGRCRSRADRRTACARR